MRWIHIAIVVVFAAATLIFLIQNREIVSMDFLGFSVRAPLAVMAATFYVLGAITGGSAYASAQSIRAGGRATAPAGCLIRLSTMATVQTTSGDRPLASAQPAVGNDTSRRSD